MNRSLCFLFPIVILLAGCREGIIRDIASCANPVEKDETHYIVRAEINCVDTELDLAPAYPINTGKARQPKWKSIAVLERHPFPKRWHLFHIPDSEKKRILNAYRNQASFQFILRDNGEERYRDFHILNNQFPEEPYNQFYPVQNFIVPRLDTERNPDNEGIIVKIDPGVRGEVFGHPDNREIPWHMDSLIIHATAEGKGARNSVDAFPPYIPDNHTLEVYILE